MSSSEPQNGPGNRPYPARCSSNRRNAVLLAVILGGFFLVVGVVTFFVQHRDTPASAPLAQDLTQVDEDQAIGSVEAVGTLPVAPGVNQLDFDPRLADEFAKIDPAAAGWESETFAEAASAQLKSLGKLLEAPDKIDADHLLPLVTTDVTSEPLRPHALNKAFEDSSVIVHRLTSEDVKAISAPGVVELVRSLQTLVKPLEGATEMRSGLKIVRVDMSDDTATTRVRFHLNGRQPRGTVQINAVWLCHWTRNEPPQLKTIRVEQFEEILPGNDGSLNFEEVTLAVLGANDSFHSQLVWSYDHWRSRSDKSLVSDLAGNHGIAVGDLNGDGLDDVYLLQSGGLPNKLFLHNADGNAVDVSAEVGADLLDFSRSALFVDLDNDGDQDLVVGLAWQLLILDNDGAGGLNLRTKLTSHGQIHSLSAVDYDNDGNLDLYACGRYSDGALPSEQSIMGFPLPVHDANNGGPNTLWRNNGSSTPEFIDVTHQVGLDVNNRRFSYAAAWDDFDNDGDQDLYVANDFGRNNLYRNDSGRFHDIAAQAGVEDLGPGMSASWGDCNGDGLVDLYVSNMFSSAGNRITYQSQFMPDADAVTRGHVRRLSRGNSLFLNSGDGTFHDVTFQAGIQMGRWAWGANFVDFNNDGWEDIVVANGFITTEDTGDL